MRTIFPKLLALGFALLYHTPTCSGLNLVRREASDLHVLQSKITRRAPGDVLGRDRARRNGRHARVDASSSHSNARRQTDVVDAELQNEVSLYVIEVDVGTPPQRIGLHIDTGSSDMWVNVPSSRLCRQHTRYCRFLGMYDHSSSSTYSFVNNDFSIEYADGSQAAGSYVTDTVALADAELRSLQFGLANRSTTSDGVLGVGYSLNEAALAHGRDEEYPNLPAKLAGRGFINSNAYSLWLNDLDASEGSILFGGVDQAKYSGSLRTLPVLRSQGYYAHFFIGLTDIGMDGNKGAVVSDAAIPVLLDSGTTLTYLPNQIANALFETYGARYIRRAGAASISCSVADQDGSVDLTFSGLTISIPLRELVIPASPSGTGDCAFGITRADNSISVLGDTFLRSAYVVYDLENNEISMAQTAFDTGKTDIVEITSGPDAVPDATDVPNPTSISVGGAPTLILGDPGSELGDNQGAVGLRLSAWMWAFACAVLGTIVWSSV